MILRPSQLRLRLWLALQCSSFLFSMMNINQAQLYEHTYPLVYGTPTMTPPFWNPSEKTSMFEFLKNSIQFLYSTEKVQLLWGKNREVTQLRGKFRTHSAQFQIYPSRVATNLGKSDYKYPLGIPQMSVRVDIFPPNSGWVEYYQKISSLLFERN